MNVTEQNLIKNIANGNNESFLKEQHSDPNYNQHYISSKNFKLNNNSNKNNIPQLNK